MPNHAILIRPSGSELPTTPANGKAFTLEEAQGIVGGYVARVYLRDGRIMLCDEDGLLKHLPKNEVACQLAQALIVGDALVGDRDVMKGFV